MYRELAVKALNKLYCHSSQEERRKVIEAMMALGYPEYADTLITDLYQSSPNKRLAVNVFTQLAAPRHASHILRLLDDPDPVVVQLALTAVQHTSTESSRPRLRRLLTHRDKDTRSMAAWTLARIDPGSYAWIIRAHRMGWINMEALPEALPLTGDPRAMEFLTGHLDLGDPYFRTAYLGLAHIDTDAARGLLEKHRKMYLKTR